MELRVRRSVLNSLFVTAIASISLSAAAEVSELKIGRGFSLGHLPAIIMEDQKLIEKHARAEGLGELKVEWVQFAGAAAQNDALLSGSVAITANGTPGLLLLWDRTKGKQEVHGVAALNAGNQLLNTRNPKVKSIRDFGDGDKIALPAVRVSVAAILLQMEAEKTWGPEGRNRLDQYTVGLSPPDGMAALLSNSEVNANYTLEPYASKEARIPGIHTVLDSNDTLGGPGTVNLFVATDTFRKANPKTYKAFLLALEEAIEIINRDKKAAAELFVKRAKGFTMEDIYPLLAENKITYSTTPQNTMKYADFLYKVGTIKNKPTSWKSYFFSEIYDKPGS